jgi:hypothetical protein
MENHPESHHTVFAMSVWAETIPGGQPAWRGTIRALDGRRRSFSTLTDLNLILCELSGWQDSLTGPIDNTLQAYPQDGEPSSQGKA